ncbi:MAG: DUF6438 domain-containing protein [Gemmatimonadales bacterium]
MIRLSIFGLVMGVAACAPRTAAAPADQQLSDAAAGPAISLERTPCFGGCPVYIISVSPSGQVTYEGRANVRDSGTAIAQVPKQRVDTLLIELERAGYFGFASQYALSEPACGRYVTDLPTAISSATLGARTKRIEHDYGCGGAPAALAVLENRIDEVLGSGQWTGR